MLGFLRLRQPTVQSTDKISKSPFTMWQVKPLNTPLKLNLVQVNNNLVFNLRVFLKKSIISIT